MLCFLSYYYFLQSNCSMCFRLLHTPSVLLNHNQNRIIMKKLSNYITVLFFALFTFNVMAQQTVSGTVTTADGPLPGATIVVKGTNMEQQLILMEL